MLVSDLIELLEKDKITELNSSHFSQEFNKQELSQFQYALALSESVKYIELGNKVDSALWESIGSALTFNNSVKKLRFSSFENLLNKFSILQGIVNFNTSIESLEICNFVDGNNIIISLCVSLYKNQKLKELAITNCHLKSESIAVISQILEQNTSIEKLDLSHQPLDQPIKSLAKGLQNNKSLKYLILNNAVLDQSGIELLNKSLINNTTLQSLSLKDNQLDHFKASAVIDILKNCNTLKHLDLSRNQLGAYFASTIGKVFCEDSLLETLNLSYNQLSDLGITMIVRYISNLTHLKTLDLSNNNKTEFGVVMVEETFKTVAKPENFCI